MKCPACANNKIATYDTRRIEDMVVRKRKCLACDERFYTLEQYMSEEELEEVQQLRRKQIHDDTRIEKCSSITPEPNNGENYDTRTKGDLAGRPY